MRSLLCGKGVLLATWVTLLITTADCTYVTGSLTVSQLLQVIVPLHTDSANPQKEVKSVSLLHASCLQGQSHQGLKVGFQFVAISVKGSLTVILLEQPQAGCILASQFQRSLSHLDFTSVA